MNNWMNSWIIDWMKDSMNNWMNNWMKDFNYLVSKPFPLGFFGHVTSLIKLTGTVVDMRDWFVHLHCESYLFMGWYQGPVDASGCQMEENWITIDIFEFDLLEKMSSKSKIKISKFLIKSWRRDGGGITNMSLK